MPKRKRTMKSDPAERRKEEIHAHLLQSQKLLQHALKNSKGFTRQKLGKRLKLAQAKGAEGIEDVKRINREIEALKGLAVGEMAESYLCARVCKVKRMVESESLPEEIREKGLRKGVEGPGLGEEVVAARNNVMSGMSNMPAVKTVVEDCMRGFFLVMGIPMPDKGGKAAGKNSEVKNTTMKTAPIRDINLKTNETEDNVSRTDSDAESKWEGIDSSKKSQLQSSKRRKIMQEPKSNSDAESFSRYDAMLGSSDSDSEPETESASEQSIMPSGFRGGIDLSLSPEPTLTPKPKSKSKASAPLPKQTTFLPTLLGGYFSGSESEASDLEDFDDKPVIKKNRPGQMARRAIWEKKFGTGANHIKSGQGTVEEVRQGKEGWDLKRGAKDSGRGRGRGRGGFTRDSGRVFGNRGRATGENNTTLGTGVRGVPTKKDDVGILHPSWQAAKKAKELKTTATFQGKKVTFD